MFLQLVPGDHIFRGVKLRKKNCNAFQNCLDNSPSLSTRLTARVMDAIT